jgi:phenylacetate-coenzyme A ligase PaaK-like adenylate-forming protein
VTLAPRGGAPTAGPTAAWSGGRAAGYGWIVPRVVLPLFDRARGRKMGARLRQLREGQWRSPDELEAVAVTRLRRLLGHAAAHVPFYRRLLGEAGIRPDDIRSLADLSRVPETTKAALRDAGLEQTTADNLPASRRWPITTSGSGGAPFPFHADLAAEDARLATFMFALEWAGVGVWDVEVKVGNPFRDFAWLYPRPGPLARAGRRVLLGQRSGRLGMPRPTYEDLQRLVRKTAGRRPWFLRGSPSILALLGDRMLRAGAELPTSPEVVISRSEKLTAVRRATITEAFRRPVVDHYACTEVAHLAQSCPEGLDGLHVLGDRVIVRVLREDGRPAAPGEYGRVYLTDLENEVMPFINYTVGDLALVGASCACGRGLPVLAAVAGREGEVLRLPGGDDIATFAVEGYMRVQCDVRSVREYQIVQTALDRVLLKLVTTPEATRHDAERLRKALETLLAPEVTVEVAEVDDIPLEPSGKRSLIKIMAPPA